MPYFFGRREGERVRIEGADARHLARSLRARPGELVSVVQPEGRLLGVRLTEVSPTLVLGLVESEAEHQPEPSRRVTVAAARLPAPALDLLLSRCTEAGAAGFLVVSADRSVARGDRPERWAAVCREAAMLAGRLVVPDVRGPLSFQEAWTTALADVAYVPLFHPINVWATRDWLEVPIDRKLSVDFRWARVKAQAAR